MIILICGKKSKVACSIAHYFKSSQADHTIQLCSLREYKRKDKGIKMQIEKADMIIYAVCDTRTVVPELDFESYVYTNIVLFYNFVADNLNNIRRKKFIFLSSSKIYNLFDIAGEADESLPLDKIRFFKIITDTVDMLATQNKHKIINLIRKYPSFSSGYFPIYELTKAMCEYIIQKLDLDAVILRPTYLYGSEEKKNEISKMVYNAMNGLPVRIRTGSRDFVPYSFLNALLLHIIDLPFSTGIEVYNVATGVRISAETLLQYVTKLNNICHVTSEIKSDHRPCYSVSLSTKKFFDAISYAGASKKLFADETRKIFYQTYIEEIKNKKIIKECIGGSYARTYIVRDYEKAFSLVKIALGNGANNGSIKMAKELNQAKSIAKYMQSKNMDVLSPKIYDVIVDKDFCYISFEYIHGKKFDDLQVNDYSLNLHFVERVSKEISKVYGLGNDLFYHDMLNINNGRVKDRLYEVILESKKRGLLIFESIFNYKSIQINGNCYINPLIILSELKKCYHVTNQFLNKWGPCVSGDPILDNCILSNDTVKIIDPRGEDLIYLNGVPYFDSVYDLGKILFYLLGWKMIRLDKYSLALDGKKLDDNARIDFKFERDGQYFLYQHLLKSLRNVFLKCREIINDKCDPEFFLVKIMLYAGYHFLSDTYPRIVGKGRQFSQCLAEYVLGTIVINQVYSYVLDPSYKLRFEMLDGNADE